MPQSISPAGPGIADGFREGAIVDRSAHGRGSPKAIIRWIEKNLRIPEGDKVGEPFILYPWQKKIIHDVYGSPTRRAIVSFGRKNGKTALAAALLLVHLLGPKAVSGSQMYSTAQSREQASLIFNYARKMVLLSDYLLGYVTIRDSAKQLLCDPIGTSYRALSADATTAFGLSPVFTVHDELGQVRGPTSDLFDAMETASGAYENPLSFIISTQAPTDADLLSILIDDAAAGHDPKVKLFLFTADAAEDIRSPEAWAAANPGLGTFRSLEDVREQAEMAHRLPSRESAFRNLILNQRTAAEAPMLAPSVWKACGGMPDESLFEDGEVTGGLDLSSLSDLTALVLKVTDGDGVAHVKPYFWTPAGTLRDRELRDRVPYSLWVKQGYLFTTPGVVLDYDDMVEKTMEIVSGIRNFRLLRYDRWRIEIFKAAVARHGGGKLPLEPFGQTYMAMSPAIETVEGLALSGKIRHGMHPILLNHIANARVERDAAGNRRLMKHRSSGRIDGAVAMTMACAPVTKEKEQTEMSAGSFFFIGGR